MIKCYRQNVSLLFNQTCLNEQLLPNDTHTYIYERNIHRIPSSNILFTKVSMLQHHVITSNMSAIYAKNLVFCSQHLKVTCEKILAQFIIRLTFILEKNDQQCLVCGRGCHSIPLPLHFPSLLFSPLHCLHSLSLSLCPISSTFFPFIFTLFSSSSGILSFMEHWLSFVTRFLPCGKLSRHRIILGRIFSSVFPRDLKLPFFANLEEWKRKKIP